MGDFIAFSEEIDAGMEYLEHHGILNQKWGHRNGPPYPLSAGSHSSGEKSAAKAAGIKVGGDSGKGAITNIKKFGSRSKSSPDKPQKAAKKEMTPEEKREAALAAMRSGDKKQIAKYVDQLSTDELREAQARAQMKDQLTKKEPTEQKASKEDIEKLEAMRSGDKEKVKQYADKMSYAELAEAMNKVNLTEQLNHVDPPPSAMDKLNKFMNNVDQFRANAEKGVNAYNLAAKVWNSTHKDGAQWPIIENKQQQPQNKEQQVAQNLVNQMAKNVQQAHQENQQKSYEEQAKEKLKNAKTDYKTQKEYEEWVAKQEKGKQTQQELNQKLQQKAQEENNQPKPQSTEQPKNDRKEGEGDNKSGGENQRQYTPERAPQTQSAKFNTNKSTEPTEEQKHLVEEARKSDEQYLNQMSQTSKQEVKATYDSVKDTPIASYDKSYQKDINDAFDDIMSDYNESVRRQQVTAQEKADRAETVDNAKKLMRDALREDNNDAAAYWLEVIRNNE